MARAANDASDDKVSWPVGRQTAEVDVAVERQPVGRVETAQRQAPAGANRFEIDVHDVRSAGRFATDVVVDVDAIPAQTITRAKQVDVRERGASGEIVSIFVKRIFCEVDSFILLRFFLAHAVFNVVVDNEIEFLWSKAIMLG